jgi:hypothetical protein
MRETFEVIATALRSSIDENRRLDRLHTFLKNIYATYSCFTV